ncbi:hypothetical protein L0Y65_06265 [Candidatus Micrarchaeota archaeon]|nr:hypothetical protein [Candidatus Micrarchaeota archaeon]
MKALILGLVLAAFVISGCTFFEQPQNTTNETPPPPPPPPVVKKPVITITSPGSGELIMSEGDAIDVTLTIGTQNLIVKSPGGAAKVGEGHFRVTVDDGVPQTVTSKTYVLSALGAGEHRVKVELLNNDRTQYSPAISKETAFTVEKQKPPEYVPQNHTVSISDTAYSPSSLTVKVGDSVTWTNNGARPQTATCFIGGSKVFDTGSVAVGKSVTIKMTETLECDYYSILFRAISGKIKVESNGTETQ